jgi:L-lactate dehydrogenase complex protein LldG
VVGDFRARLEALDGALHEVGDAVAARELAAALVGSATVARWDDVLLAEVAGREADPRHAEVSLIVADVGVADTGAIGFAHGPGRPRATGLLPDRQIALLARTDLVRSMAEALARWFTPEGARVGNLVFAAGPSRTADIEQTMMLGVHAPRSLDVVLYG